MDAKSARDLSSQSNFIMIEHMHETTMKEIEGATEMRLLYAVKKRWNMPKKMFDGERIDEYVVQQNLPRVMDLLRVKGFKTFPYTDFFGRSQLLITWADETQHNELKRQMIARDHEHLYYQHIYDGPGLVRFYHSHWLSFQSFNILILLFACLFALVQLERSIRAL